jgi:hypothetical protein
MPFTTDYGEKIGAVAAALAQTLDAIEGLVALPYDPIGQETPSIVACVSSSTLGRTALGDPETRLGRDDWGLDLQVRLYHRLEDPEPDWASARRIVGEIVAAVDRDYQLGGEVREAKVTTADLRPSEPDEAAPRMLIGDLTVQAIALMPDPT